MLRMHIDLRELRRAWLLIALAVLWDSSALFAQEVQTLPPPQLVSRDAIVDVHTLPPPAHPLTPGTEVVHGKPFLVPDPVGLRQWKDFLQQVPQALPEAPGFIQDTVPPVTPELPKAATVLRQFEGLANADNLSTIGGSFLPPDPNLGVGPAHIFQMVNAVGRITDKLGGSVSTFGLSNFFGVTPPAVAFDPRVIYDAISGRWFASILKLEGSTSSSIVLAVSTTGDPTGPFCRYLIGNPSSETFQQDFPILGISDDKVVISYRGFTFSDSYLGSGYYVVNKVGLTTCASTVSFVRAAPNPSMSTQYPVQSLSSSGDLYMAMHGGGNQFSLITISGTNQIRVTPQPLSIRNWFPPPDAPQQGSGVLLATNDADVISAAWQNHSLWLAGNESCTPAGDTAARSCLRLIELRTDTSSVRQDMTFGTSGEYYYYPALRPDSAGNLHVVFTRSSSSAFAGIRATGRLIADPLNTLQVSSELRSGGGSQTSSGGRMGDYSGAAVDPSNPQTVWVMGEYIRSTANSDWGSAVAALSFPLTPSQAFVTRLYQQVLGREPDPVGLAYWVQQLQQDAAVVLTVLGFFQSTEFLSRNTTDDQFLHILYRTFLDREPDQAGFSFLLDELQSGRRTRDNLLDGFMFAPEFAGLASFLPAESRLTGFVTLLYRRILNRNPDPAGIQFFLTQLQQNHALLPTIQHFLASPEFQSRATSNTEFVTLLYQLILRRSPDTNGLAYWVGLLNQGAATREQLVAQFSTAPEFQAIQQGLFP